MIKLVNQKSYLMPMFHFAKKLLIQVSLWLAMSYAAFAQSSYDKLLNSIYKKTVPLISPEDLHRLIQHQKNVILLDTRSLKEYAVSHLPNSTCVGYDTLDTGKIESLAKDAKIIVYCSVGYRSERIGEKLLDMGFKDVHNLYGGIFQWKNQDHAVVNLQGVATDSVHTYNKTWSKWLQKGIKVYE
ncbi:rhodanese-like domain-containing protein [Fulvivirgaceae bacterium BMA12]|uniref:Rhodanese-like domain-containing protein n=1 Tax=Agaribacillus aureus TaxID=3051825 RepID=A0ABT8L5G3_9BACT|nr:rhodanese-like domain-containing protein [Fulvivirgaceae bacterium BMA12]